MKLKPCPFCGRLPERRDSIESVFCKKCKIVISLSVWQKRHSKRDPLRSMTQQQWERHVAGMMYPA